MFVSRLSLCAALLGLVHPLASAFPATGSELQKLQTTDAATHEGQILRVEKSVVVLLSGSTGAVEDIPLQSLDARSKAAVQSWEFRSRAKPAIPDPRVVPGQKIILTFPEMGASNQTDPARIQIRVPENYQPNKPVPLALFLAGGAGSDNCDVLNSMVDPTEWVLVAFPYPKANPSVLKAVEARKSAALIAFQRPMLERLRALIPNTDPGRRVVIGTSNGAHMIAVGVCDGWKEFSDYFSAFVLHEGGGAQSQDFKNLKNKEVFVMMGEKSTSRDYSEWILNTILGARIKADSHIAVGEGHGMGAGSKSAVKDWVAKLKPAKPTGLQSLPQRTSLPMTAPGAGTLGGR